MYFDLLQRKKKKKNRECVLRRVIVAACSFFIALKGFRDGSTLVNVLMSAVDDEHHFQTLKNGSLK